MIRIERDILHLQSAQNNAHNRNSTRRQRSNNMRIETAQQLGQTLATPTMPRSVCAADADARAMMCILKLHGALQAQRRGSPQWTEVDSVGRQEDESCSIPLHEIAFTAVSIVLRVVALFMNVAVAVEYQTKGQHDYFVWMLVCMAVPMCITALMYANMRHQDGKFSKGRRKAARTVVLVILASLFLRYGNSLLYSARCKLAERRGDRQQQMRYYKLNLLEESDVAFIRLFECFLETAPLKLLNISIVLRMETDMTIMQFLLLVMYFFSTAWSLGSYSRCIRAAQADKNKLTYWGMVPQLCWYFCISVSRSVCIACVASLFPLWTVVACLCHVVLLGSVTYYFERPPLTSVPLYNYLFCLALGAVYLFAFVPVKDAPTRGKYVLYYLICSAENFACIGLFVSFASSAIKESAFLFYTLCFSGVAIYFLGIACMAFYYTYFHPNVTARKANVNNN